MNLFLRYFFLLFKSIFVSFFFLLGTQMYGVKSVVPIQNSPVQVSACYEENIKGIKLQYEDLSCNCFSYMKFNFGVVVNNKKHQIYRSQALIAWLMRLRLHGGSENTTSPITKGWTGSFEQDLKIQSHFSIFLSIPLPPSGIDVFVPWILVFFTISIHDWQKSFNKTFKQRDSLLP